VDAWLSTSFFIVDSKSGKHPVVMLIALLFPPRILIESLDDGNQVFRNTPIAFSSPPLPR